MHPGSARGCRIRASIFFQNYLNRVKLLTRRYSFKDIPGVCTEKGNPAATARLFEEVRNSDVLVQVVRAFQTEIVNATVAAPLL
ncbi:MAG: hypothetical protein ACOX1I_07100 [Dethiobacteria bacterium]